MTSQLEMFPPRAKNDDVMVAPFPTAKRHRDRELDDEAMVRHLEKSGNYRVLRRLVARAAVGTPRPGFPRLGVIVDTETTGLDHRKDEIIEIGAAAFTFDDDGTIGDVTGVYGGLQQPLNPIPPAITRLTGITDEMVAGQVIDVAELCSLVAPADLVIAHNASFDRPFCEAFSSIFSDKAWACSVAEVDWAARGFEGTKLGYLIGQIGCFHNGHRAVDDCFALLEVLAYCVGPDGGLSFYYTERLPAYNLFKDYKEVQKLVVPTADLLRPEATRPVLNDGPPGSADDFRDPKVWYDANRQAYRMLLGAAIDGDPAVLLYGSEDGNDWQFLSVLYRAPEHFRQHGARCVECPDFIELDGRFVLVMGFVGYTEPTTGRHNLLYAQVGTFDDDRFMPLTPALQELDFGTDFYAMQSFNAKEGQIAFAWLFNWEFRKPAGSPYSGELSLPRVLGLDAQLRLTMLPEKGYQALRSHALTQAAAGHFICEPGQPIELSLAGALDGIRIVGRGRDGESFTIAHVSGRLQVNVAEDAGEIEYRSTPLSLESLTVFFDRGVLEIFANDGVVCGTRRTYKVTALTALELIASGATRIDACEGWSYNSAWRW